MNTKRGFLVAIEGGEGSGKSTLIPPLLQALRTKFPERAFLQTKEPGGTPLGAELRRLLLKGDCPISPLAETMLFCADRAQHVSEVIEPAIKNGAVVITDRFSVSTLAYQGCAGGVREALELDSMARQGINPYVIYLSIPPNDGLARMTDPDRMSRKPIEYHEAVHTGMRTHAATFYNIRIDARLPREVVLSDAVGFVSRIIEGGDS